MISGQENDKLNDTDGKMSHISWFIQGLIDVKFNFPEKPNAVIPKKFRQDYHQARQIGKEVKYVRFQ